MISNYLSYIIHLFSLICIEILLCRDIAFELSKIKSCPGLYKAALIEL
jgi:hypothetical protein